METGKGQANTITKTSSKTILAQESENTADLLETSQANISREPKNTWKDKPTSMAEAVSLLQTRFFDLRSLGLQVVILADTGELYARIHSDDHKFDVSDGHILMDGERVVDLSHA